MLSGNPGLEPVTQGGIAMTSIALYQHSIGDFKVSYTTSSGNGEQHFQFDLGGAISFVLGLIVAARQRGEEVGFHASLKVCPLVNRGFAAGFASNNGRNSLPEEKMKGYDSHNRNPFFPDHTKGKGEDLSEEVESLLNSFLPRFPRSF